jgi:hypothetical protein
MKQEQDPDVLIPTFDLAVCKHHIVGVECLYGTEERDIYETASFLTLSLDYVVESR